MAVDDSKKFSVINGTAPSTFPDPTDAGRLLAVAARLEARLSTIDELKQSVDELSKSEQRRGGAANVWRALGTIAAGVAITIGGAALTLAFQASADHERVEEMRVEIEELHQQDRERDAQWAQMEGTLRVTTEVLNRVERRLDDLDARDGAASHTRPQRR